MNIDRNIIFTLLILCFVTAIPATLFFRKMPVAELLPSEKAFINFSSAPVVVLAEPKPLPVFSGLDCPVKAPAKPAEVIIKSLPPAEVVVVKAAPSIPPRVSMIYYECGATKRAIIGGHILQVGSTFDDYVVVKIEKSRVQIRSTGKDIWLNMH